MIKRNRSLFSILVPLALFVSAQRSCHQDVSLAAPEPDRAQQGPTVECPESFIRELQKLVSGLSSTLGDESKPIRDRVHAARLLGRLQYTPAIPHLIRHIGLVDPELVISGNEIEPFVSVHALAAYGDAAVPEIVEAYLKEPDPVENVLRPIDRRRRLLLTAINEGGTQNVAVAYLKGLAAQRDTRISRAKLNEMLSHLHRWRLPFGVEPN